MKRKNYLEPDVRVYVFLPAEVFLASSGVTTEELIIQDDMGNNFEDL